MRDRLIELISQVQYMGGLEGRLADHLLSEGVIVPPCKVGDKLYEISSGEVLNCTVEIIDISLTERMSMYIDISIKYPTYSAIETIEMDYFGKTVFLTREEAEKALAERSENGT